MIAREDVFDAILTTSLLVVKVDVAPIFTAFTIFHHLDFHITV